MLRRANSTHVIGAVAAREREQRGANAAHVVVLRAHPRFDRLRDRVHDAVREQNAEERSDERGGDLLTDLGRRCRRSSPS